MERREAEELYRSFGKAWAKFPETWKLYLLSSHTEFELHLWEEGRQEAQAI